MRIQCISRPRRTSSLPTTGTLFSAWHATTHAEHPVQAPRSIAMPQVRAPIGCSAQSESSASRLAPPRGRLEEVAKCRFAHERPAFHRMMGLRRGQRFMSAGLLQRDAGGEGADDPVLRALHQRVGVDANVIARLVRSVSARSPAQSTRCLAIARAECRPAAPRESRRH